MRREIFFEVDGGTLAALDHGGTGQPVLLVHGSGHNAAAWAGVVPGLLPGYRVVAVDLRGHGHSTARSTAGDQYWRDLAVVVTALDWQRPLLVGHSTGGYAVTAVTAAGLVSPAGIGVLDGLVLDDRETTARALAGFRTPESAAELQRLFGYGRRLDAAQRDEWIDEQVRTAAGDWLNAGADPEILRAVSERACRPDAAGGYVRMPTTGEIAATTVLPPDASLHPGVEVYDQLACPTTIVLPDEGFYASRRDEVAAIVAAAPNRRLVAMPGGHNVVMTHPTEVATLIRTLTTEDPATGR